MVKSKNKKICVSSLQEVFHSSVVCCSSVISIISLNIASTDVLHGYMAFYNFILSPMSATNYFKWIVNEQFDTRCQVSLEAGLWQVADVF